MLQDFEFKDMVVEIEEAQLRKKQAVEDIKNIHIRYCLKPSGYIIRLKNTLRKEPELFDNLKI